jgi:hypothetical protein
MTVAARVAMRFAEDHYDHDETDTNVDADGEPVRCIQQRYPTHFHTIMIVCQIGTRNVALFQTSPC